MPISYYLLLVFLSITLVCSLINFRLHTRALKIISILLACELACELLATIGFHYLREYFNIQSNNGIYNSYVLIQFLGYAFFFQNIIYLPWFKKIIRGFIFTFPLFWVSTFIFVNISDWDSYVFIAGNTFTVIACEIYFYQLYKEEQLISLKNNPEFWIGASLFFYNISSIPITGMFNYLMNTDVNMAIDFSFVIRLLGIVSYCIMIYAYLCNNKTWKFT